MSAVSARQRPDAHFWTGPCHLPGFRACRCCVCAYIGAYGAILILRMEWPCPPFFAGVVVAPCMLISCTDCPCSASVITGTRVALPSAAGLQVLLFLSLFCRCVYYGVSSSGARAVVLPMDQNMTRSLLLPNGRGWSGCSILNHPALIILKSVALFIPWYSRISARNIQQCKLKEEH